MRRPASPPPCRPPDARPRIPMSRGRLDYRTKPCAGRRSRIRWPPDCRPCSNNHAGKSTDWPDAAPSGQAARRTYMRKSLRHNASPCKCLSVPTGRPPPRHRRPMPSPTIGSRRPDPNSLSRISHTVSVKKPPEPRSHHRSSQTIQDGTATPRPCRRLQAEPTQVTAHKDNRWRWLPLISRCRSLSGPMMNCCRRCLRNW